jgi:hypothetical protein
MLEGASLGLRVAKVTGVVHQETDLRGNPRQTADSSSFAALACRNDKGWGSAVWRGRPSPQEGDHGG